MTTTRTARSPANQQVVILAILILLLGFALRLTALMRLPLFVDETVHLIRTHGALAGDLWEGLGDRKWLYPITLLPFGPTGPEGPWIARYVSALCGLVSIAAALALGKALDSRRAGLVAAALYSTVPMAVFHERQALVDPMMGAFAALSLAAMVWLARRPSLRLAIVLGMALAGAYLTKLQAMALLPLPVIAALLLARQREGGWQDSRLIALPGVELILRTRARDAGLKALLLSLLAMALAALLVGIVFQAGAWSGYRATTRFEVTGSNLILADLLTPAGRALMRDNLATVADALWRYVGPVPLALALIFALGSLIGGRQRREALFLLYPALLTMALPLLTRVTAIWMFAPRYLHINTAPLLVLAGVGLGRVADRIKALVPQPPLPRRGGGKIAAQVLSALLLAGGLIPAVLWDATLIRDPRRADFAPYDEFTYLTGRWSGWGRVDLARTMLDLWDGGSGPGLDALSYDQDMVQINYLAAYLGPRVGVFDELLPESEEQRQEIARWLGEGDRVFFVEHSRGRPMPESPYETRLALRWTVPVPDGDLRVYEVVGAAGPLARQVYDALGGEPFFMSDDHTALATSLNADPTPRPVIVYPGNHAPSLRERTGLDVRAFRPATWPLTAPLAAATLAGEGLGEAGTPVEVILVNEAASDPHRAISLALQASLYWVDEEWFGLLHHIRYVTGPADPSLTPVEARYEGGITLEAAYFDAQRAPGEPLRVILLWRTPVPIADSFAVFVHVVEAGGTLVAQHDGIPGGGLFPMTSWGPGEAVADRFAIPLPADLPPGEVVVWVGLYHPANGLRLRVELAGEGGPDYVIIGRVAIVQGE